MFYKEIPWFYQDIKSENLCFLNLYSVHAAKILPNKSSQMRNETPLQF